MVACLLQSVQNTQVLVFNYRKEKLLTCTCLKVGAVEKLSFHPVRLKSLLLMGKNYLRLWDLHPQENVLKESQQLVPLKVEKESRFYDMSWQCTYVSAQGTSLWQGSANNAKNPLLFVLTGKNKLLIIQNDTLINTIVLGEKDAL